MILAEQIRNRSRKDLAPVTHLGVNSAIAAMASNGLSAADIDSRIATFGTTMQLLYEPKVAAGTASQFYRGNKTWSAIAISDVTGLSASLSGLSDAAAAKVAKSGDVMTGPLVMPTYLKGALPSASTYARSQIYVSDLTGGAEFCYSDGSSWRRMSDRSLVN